MSRRRRAALRVVVVLVALAVLALLARDLPRRWLERVLSERFAARVEIERLRLPGLKQVRLEGVRVTDSVVWPQLHSARAAAITTPLHIRRLLRSDLESLDLDALEVVLAAPCEKPPALPARPLEARIGRLGVPDAEVRFVDADQTFTVHLAGEVENLGPSSGHLRAELASERLDPTLAAALLVDPTTLCGAPTSSRGTRPLLVAARLTGEIDLETGEQTWNGGAEGFSSAAGGVAIDVAAARLELSLSDSFASPRGAATLAADRLELSRGESRLASSAPRVRLTLTPREDGARELHVEPDIDVLGRASLDLVLPSDGSLRPARLAARASAVPLSPWLGLLPREDGLAEADPEVLGQADVSASGSLEELSLEIATRLDRLAFSARGRRLEIVPARLHLHGMAHDLATFSGDVRGEARLTAIAPPPPLEDPGELLPVTLRLDGSIAAGQTLGARGVLGIVTSQLGDGQVAGDLTIGDSRVRASADLDWRVARLATLLAALDASVPGELDGSATLKGHLEGDVADPALSARIELTGATWSPPAEDAAAPGGPESPASTAWRWRGAPLLELARRPGSPRIAWHVVETDGGIRLLPGQTERPYTLAAGGDFQVEGSTLEIAELQAELPELLQAELSGAWRDGAGSGHLDLNLLEPDRWTVALGLGAVVPGYDTQGSLRAALDWEAGRRTGLTAVGSLAFAGGMSSFDGATVVAGIHADSSLRLAWEEDALSWAGAGAVGGFEALIGELYADYRDRSAELRFSGESQRDDAGRSWHLEAGAALSGKATEAETFFDRDGAGRSSWGLDLHVHDLETTLRDAIQGPFQGSMPSIADLRAGGRLEATLRGRSEGDRREVGGRFTATDTLLATPEGAYAITALDLDLPFRLRWDGDALAASSLEDALDGSLRFERLHIDALEVPETSATLGVLDDTVYFGRQVTFPLLAGTVTLEGAVLERLLRADRRLSSSIRLNGLQLADLSAAMDWLPLEGEANGYFPVVRMTATNLTTEGESRVSVFGGEVVFEDIAGQDLLTRFPRLIFSARFSDIDLERLTRTFDFGSMTGMLYGYFRNVEVFRDVPVRFSARLETREVPGVRQKISIKAVNNLAMVGGGEKVGIFDRGIYRFFENYRYQKLGVQILMRQDRFLLRGLEHRKGRELILVGKSPRRLDIVNARPGRTVFFQTMMQRIGNLDVRRSGKKARAKPYTGKAVAPGGE